MVPIDRNRNVLLDHEIPATTPWYLMLLGRIHDDDKVQSSRPENKNCDFQLKKDIFLHNVP